MSDTPPEVDRQVHAEMRGLGWTTWQLVACALFIALPAFEVARERLGVELWQSALAGGFYGASMLGATAAFHLLGRWSLTYRIVNAVETVAIAFASAFLIIVSRRVDSAYLLLYFAQILHNGSSGTSRRFNFACLALVPLTVMASFAWHLEWGSVAFSAAFGLLGLYVYGTLSRAAERLAVTIRDRDALRDQLAEAKLEGERARIARDLHDGVGAELNALLWAAREGGELEGRLRQGIDELRNVVWALRCKSESWGELIAYVRDRGHELCGAGEVRFELQASGDGQQQLDGALRDHVLRIILEGVRNAVRHSGARRVTVELARDEAKLSIAVRDDGHGFDPSAIAGKPGGLQNLHARAAELGATLVVRSTDRGTSVEVTR